MQPRDIQKTVTGHVLVAEDDSVVQMVVGRMLEQAGYKADFVADGKEAISALESNDYDLVVMDCMMPKMDGFEATRFIRSAGSGKINPDIPVIALTGLTAKDDLLQCRQAGMNKYVNKPVDAYMLISAIDQCLGGVEEELSVSQANETPCEPVWDDGFLSTIIDKFLAEVPQVITDLQDAIRLKDVVKLQEIGHRLRGATDILNASTLSARSLALEQSSKAGDIKLSSGLALELIKDLQKLTAALSE